MSEFIETRMTFHIPKVPHAQQRMRFTKMGRTYSPNVAHEHWTIVHVQKSLPADFSLLTGPLSIDLTFCFARPQAHCRRGRYEGQLKPSAPQYCKSAKDLDNLCKQVFDASNKVIYEDDRQIVESYARKIYVPIGEEARTMFTITTLGGKPV